jgi:DNA-binding XRE family transcriptional regulator
MGQEQIVDEADLAALAKKYREASGKNRAEAARELDVARPTLIQAEERPEMSLTKLRKRIIATYSLFEVAGPVYLLRKKRK